LNFQNEYMRLYRLTNDKTPGTEWIFTDLTPTGHVRNYMPIGPALLWAPLYLLLALGQALLATAGLAPPPDGYGHVLQLAPGITGIVAATWATWLSWRLARRFTSETAAAAGALLVWLGSHALYYSLVSPSYSHAASMLTSAIFFERWLREEPVRVRRVAILGALAGLSALMRWQDAIFLGVAMLEALQLPDGWSRRATAAASALAGFLVVFSPQMIVWDVLYGQPFALPQGPSFMRWTAPHLWDVLLSNDRGLFTWAPLLILAIWGLVQFAVRHRNRAFAIAAVVLVSWYVNAAVADWWAGEAFGSRRFLSLYPLFVLGLAMWVDAGGRPATARTVRISVGLVLTLLNGLFLLQYELALKGLEQIAPYPNGWFDMYVARLLVPFKLILWWHH
jgi:hypothetical protein